MNWLLSIMADRCFSHDWSLFHISFCLCVGSGSSVGVEILLLAVLWVSAKGFSKWWPHVEMTDAMLFRWTMRPRLKRQSFYGSNPTFINLWNETHFSCLISQRSATVSLSRKNAKTKQDLPPQTVLQTAMPMYWLQIWLFRVRREINIDPRLFRNPTIGVWKRTNDELGISGSGVFRSQEKSGREKHAWKTCLRPWG